MAKTGMAWTHVAKHRMTKPLRENPGLAISGALHAALIAVALIGFSHPNKFQDTQETIPVEVVDSGEFNQVMKGDKTARLAKPQPKAEKLAELSEPKPLSALVEAKKEVSPPPSPLKRQPDPGLDSAKDEPKPPQTSAALPPRRQVDEPARPEPKAEVVKQQAPPTPPRPAKALPDEVAEALEPKPVPKPKTPPKVEPKPDEQTEPKPVAAPKKPTPVFKPDQLAKLLDQERQKVVAENPVEKPIPKPNSGVEAKQPSQTFDPGDISKFLSKDAPRRQASTGQELQQVASLGSPSASAARMSPLLWGQLDSVMLDQYKRCWTFIGLAGQKKYIPEIRVQFAQDGSLASPPELLNPPSDPNLRSLAESAIRAVRRCDPLRIPDRYQPYYEQWKGRIVRFNPEEML